jgi:hypothetical protein
VIISKGGGETADWSSRMLKNAMPAIFVPLPGQVLHSGARTAGYGRTV